MTPFGDRPVQSRADFGAGRLQMEWLRRSWAFALRLPSGNGSTGAFGSLLGRHCLSGLLSAGTTAQFPALAALFAEKVQHVGWKFFLCHFSILHPLEDHRDRKSLDLA